MIIVVTRAEVGRGAPSRFVPFVCVYPVLEIVLIVKVEMTVVCNRTKIKRGLTPFNGIVVIDC